MLSASSFDSKSSSGFSTISTPSSQFPTDSRQNNSNPLTDLVETEQAYIDILKMIDCQIAPIWMKQMTTASPDFSELLIHTQEILQANKKFCIKLTRTATDIDQITTALLQWINDLEIPYSNYCRTFIPNLNQRYDIVKNPAIQDLLKTLSLNASYEINLESLFNAPIQQLKYYEGLYNRLLENADTNHTGLLEANKKLNSIMTLTRNNNTTPNFRPVISFTPMPLPKIQTNFHPSYVNPNLVEFERQVDCSRTIDLHTEAQITYQLRIANPGVQIVLRDSFIMISEDNRPSFQVHFLLTSEVLVMCRELSLSQFLLIYPAIPISEVTVRSEAIDREIVGEFILRFTIFGRRHIRVHADSKKIRNTWVGVDQDAPSTITLAPQSLTRVIQRRRYSQASNYSYHNSFVSEKGKSISENEFFAYYTEPGDVSPLESSDEEKEEEIEDIKEEIENKHQEAKMDTNDTQIQSNSVPVIPPPPPKNQTVKIIPHVPIVARALLQNDVATPTPPKKDKMNVKDRIAPNKQVNGPLGMSSHVPVTHIEPPTAQMSKMSISTQEQSTPLSSPFMYSPQSPKPFDSKPSSPRAIEVQRAVIPKAMQAVTQKTDDYLSNNQHPPYPRGSSANHLNQSKPLPNPMMHQRPPYGNNQHHPNSHHQQQQQQQRQQQQQQYQQQQQQQQQQQARPPMGYNNMRPMPPNHMNSARNHPGIQQGNARSYEGTVSPPHSPNGYNLENETKKILFSNSQCDVFHWANQSWYAADGQCLLQIRLSHNHRSCVAVQLQNTGQLYLTAWIMPSTVIRQPSPTDVNISLFMGDRKENYLIHFPQPQDAHLFADILRKAHQESTLPQRDLLPEQEVPEPVDTVNVPQTLTLVMECKAKLFIQNETNSWSTFGSVKMKISLQSPSQRFMIQMENDKTKLVSATVKSGNVERISSKRISFLLADEAAKTSIVYMIHLREEESGNKIYDYLRTQNAKNGW